MYIVTCICANYQICPTHLQNVWIFAEGAVIDTLATSILIAIGGGGATHGTHPELDEFCLRFLPERPRIGYVGIASNHDPAKFGHLSGAFHSRAGALSDLPKGCSRQEAVGWAAGLDLVYIGGGNPVRLTGQLSASGIHAAIFAASRRGTVIAGISAGAMCWFDRFLWRSPGDGLQLARGLGLVPGVMTPHSLTEPDRLGHLAGLISAGDMSSAIAVDDGAALVLKDGVPSAGFPGLGPPFVHRICRDPLGRVRQTRLMF